MEKSKTYYRSKYQQEYDHFDHKSLINIISRQGFIIKVINSVIYKTYSKKKMNNSKITLHKSWNKIYKSYIYDDYIVSELENSRILLRNKNNLLKILRLRNNYLFNEELNEYKSH
jgi:hypothetical protein